METYCFTCHYPDDVMKFRLTAEDYGAFVHCTLVLPLYNHNKDIVGRHYGVVYSHVCPLEVEIKTVGGVGPAFDEHAACLVNKVSPLPFALLSKEDKKLLYKAAIDNLPNLG